MKTPTKRQLVFWLLGVLLAFGLSVQIFSWLPTAIAFAKDSSRFDIRSFSAKVDGQALGDGYGEWSRVKSDCSMTSGSATLSCVSSHFVAADVGKVIAVYGAGPTRNGFVQPLSTRIAAFISENKITLAATALNSVTHSERVVWGHDDTISIQTAITAACAAGRGLVYVPAGRSLTSGVTVGCSDVGVQGAGRALSALENWNINPMNGNVPIVYFSVSGAADQSVMGASLKDLEIRQVKYPTTVQQAFCFNQTFKALGENLRVIGYSYECAVDGGGAHNYGDELRNSEFGPCGNGGPAYKLTTAGINYNGAHAWIHDNKVSMSGQGEEYGGRGAHVENNEFDGSTLAGGQQGQCFNIGSTGAGVWDVWFVKNKCRNFGTAVHGGNSIGTMDRVHIEGNTFTDSGGVSLSGGQDTNSVTCGTTSAYCENDTVVHGVSTIKNNTLISNTVQTFIRAGGCTGLGLAACRESVDIEGNTHRSQISVAHIDIVDQIPEWKPSTAYSTGANGYAYPTVLNGYVYQATVAGISGAAEPIWPANVGAKVIDGGVIWANRGLQPRWQIKDETFVNPPSAGYLIFDGASRERVSFTNVTGNNTWSIWHRNYDGRGNVSGAPPSETIPANVHYSDSDRYWGALPATFGKAAYFPLGTRIRSATPTSGNVGLVVTTAGWNAPAWKAATAFTANCYIQAVTDNGHFYRNLAACTSGSLAPAFPATAGATVTETSVGKPCTWRESGPDAQFAPLSGKDPAR